MFRCIRQLNQTAMATETIPSIASITVSLVVGTIQLQILSAEV